MTGAELKAARVHVKLNVRWFARWLDKSVADVRAWEAGEREIPAEVAQLARFIVAWHDRPPGYDPVSEPPDVDMLGEWLADRLERLPLWLWPPSRLGVALALIALFDILPDAWIGPAFIITTFGLILVYADSAAHSESRVAD